MQVYNTAHILGQYTNISSTNEAYQYVGVCPAILARTLTVTSRLAGQRFVIICSQLWPDPKVMPTCKDFVKIHPCLIPVIAKIILIPSLCTFSMKQGIPKKELKNQLTIGIVCICQNRITLRLKLTNIQTNTETQKFEPYTRFLYYQTSRYVGQCFVIICLQLRTDA